MSDIPSQKVFLNIENKRFRAATTVSLMDQIGRVINWILDNVELPSVGEVIWSRSSEAQVQAVRGVGFVLADGRDVTGSSFNTITGLTVIPDIRARFIRGKNNGRSDGNENPDGELALGAVQLDAFESHRHFIEFDGDQVGSAGSGYATARQNGVVNRDFTGPPQNHAGKLPPVLTVADEGTSFSLFDPLTGVSRTKLETNPRYVVENAFIRIN